MFSWHLTDLGYKQLGKALVMSSKQREQEDLACGDSAAHPSSFIQQSQTPFALFGENDSNRAAKARLTLGFNPLGVEHCGFVSKVATGKDFSINFFFFLFLQNQQSYLAIILLDGAGSCFRASGLIPGNPYKGKT